MKQATVVIKKYGNRRLYDTSGSTYVNLEDIARLIRNGKDIQVLDAKTGDDLTRLTLMQIITEDAKDKPTLPLELLRQLVIATDRARQEFMAWYLKSAFDTYQKVQEAMQSRLNEVQSAVLSPIDTMRRFFGSTPDARSPQAEDEVAALRQRISELEARLAETQPKARRPRSTTSKKRRESAAKAANR